MKSLFIPLAIEYDPSETSYKDTFKFTSKDVYEVMKSMYEIKIKDDEIKIADIFMDLIQDKKIPDNLILYFATYGACELFENYKCGLGLSLDANDEVVGGKE